MHRYCVLSNHISHLLNLMLQLDNALVVAPDGIFSLVVLFLKNLFL
jgi:hypothetical protein